MADAGAAQCAGCGFVLFEERRAGPRLRRPGRPVLVGAVALAAVVAVVMVAATRETPPKPLGPVAASEAEVRLEQRLRAGGVADAASVTCAGAVRRDRLTRCQVGYEDGDVQLILVELGDDGRLDIENPYPAQRRPG